MTSATKPHSFHAVGICGSLRSGSFNRAALQAAVQVAPPGLTIEILDYSQVPLYSQDVESQGFPKAVLELGARIAAADAIVIATPEYNYSVPGVLKNFIDWLTRLPNHPLERKPLAILGASPSAFGTVRAQLHLRQIAVYPDMLPLNKPEVMITHVHQKVNDAGKLFDEPTRKLIGELMSNLYQACIDQRVIKQAAAI